MTALNTESARSQLTNKNMYVIKNMTFVFILVIVVALRKNLQGASC